MKARKRFEIIPRVVDTTQRRIILNVGGRKHETYLSTVRNYPDTRLYWVVENVTKAIDYDSEKIELFFDRHPSIFEQVLNYYRTGKLHCPHDVCGPLFEEELAYWGIDEKEMEHCCWTSYSQHRDAEHNLKSFNVHEGELDQDTDMESDKQEEPTPARDCGARLKWWTKYQPKIWPILEEPHSSKPAKIFSIISVALIILSVGTSCALTLPQFSKEARAAQGSLSPGRDPTTNLIFSIIDYFCGIWFTLELLLRIIFCPRRRVFFRRISNWIDILSVMPFYLRLLDPDGGYLADALLMIRLLRLFRFFRLLYGLQILLHTLKASSYELGLLLLILLIPVILFSSIIYYIERAGDPHTKFRSIPESFWWSLITMTTVGYGDITPKTWGGKIIGGACAICGLLVVALPISIIGSNFNLYYAHAQARLKLPKKKNKVMLNTITSDFSNRSHNFSGTRRKGLRMRSHATLENGEDGMAGTRNSISNGRVNSFARQNSNEVKRNSRAWSIPSNKSTPDINTQSNEAKLSPKASIITRERKYSRNERVVPKLGDLPEKDESEENDHLTNPRRDSEPNQNQNNNYRDSLDVPDGVEYYSPGDRLPLWIAQNGKTSRWRSFSVPSNAQRPFQSHLPRKSHSDSSNMCKRCSLPRETQDFCADVYDGSSSGEGCCRCYEFEMERSAHPASNHSTYTIYIPGVDESVQVSTDSLPAWSKELPFTGTSPVQFDFVSCWKRKPPDDALSDVETTHDQEERETLISDLESECNGSRKTLPGSRKERDLPLLFIDLDMRSKHDDDSDRETTI